MGLTETAWAEALRGTRATDPELSAFLRDEYRGRMPRGTFVVLGLGDRRKARSPEIPSPARDLRAQVASWVGRAVRWIHSTRRGGALDKYPRPARREEVNP